MPTPKGAPTWNAGTSQGWVDSRGYRWRYVSEGGRRVARREHRVIVEESIGRRLEPWEVVHHKDGNPANNELSNLEIKEFGEHTAEHHRGTRKSAAARRSMEAFALMREELRRCRSANSDMLEALKAAIECGMVPITSASDGGASKHSSQVRVADQIRAAIAKAEGR